MYFVLILWYNLLEFIFKKIPQSKKWHSSPKGIGHIYATAEPAALAGLEELASILVK